MIENGGGGVTDESGLKAVQQLLDSRLNEFGFETQPLLLSWYNARVAPKFRFEHVCGDTVAFCVTSVANMFEHGFLPFLFGGSCVNERSALDECIEFHLKQACQAVAAFSPIHFKGLATYSLLLSLKRFSPKL